MDRFLRRLWSLAAVVLLVLLLSTVLLWIRSHYVEDRWVQLTGNRESLRTKEYEFTSSMGRIRINYWKDDFDDVAGYEYYLQTRPGELRLPPGVLPGWAYARGEPSPHVQLSNNREGWFDIWTDTGTFAPHPLSRRKPTTLVMGNIQNEYHVVDIPYLTLAGTAGGVIVLMLGARILLGGRKNRIAVTSWLIDAIYSHMVSSYVGLGCLQLAAATEEGWRFFLDPSQWVMFIVSPVIFPLGVMLERRSFVESQMFLGMAWIAYLAAFSIVLMRQRRRERLLRHLVDGRCTKCGYDLRESPDRCPECGAVRERIIL